MFFFTSPTSSINLPTSAYTSTAMSRSDSRDSTSSTTSFMSSSPSWDIHCSSSRPHSSSSVSSISSSAMERRDSNSSSCNWSPSPFRSCQNHASSPSYVCEPSSYLSDDDLLSLDCSSPTDFYKEFHPTPPTSIPQLQEELTTEQQIEIIRAQRDKEEAEGRAHGQHQKNQRPHHPHQQHQLQQAYRRSSDMTRKPSQPQQQRVRFAEEVVSSRHSVVNASNKRRQGSARKHLSHVA